MGQTLATLPKTWVCVALALWHFAASTVPLRAQTNSTPDPMAQSGSTATVAPSNPADDSAERELGEAAGPVRELRAISGKTVVFVFDVSGSMKGANLARAREATINILRSATVPGDRVVLFTFGAGTEKVFDKRIDVEADKAALIEQVPYQTRDGRGSNIRNPHHSALKILEAEEPRPGAIILLTDSYNDAPPPGTAEYSEYVKYYLPTGRLDKYPDTPENRDYERLLAKLYRTRKVNAYGIGVQIDEAGRPVERAPQAAAVPTETAPVSEPVTTPRAQDEFPWWLLALVGGALGLGVLGFFLAQGNKPVGLRVSGLPGGPKEFSLRGGSDLAIGGTSTFASDRITLPGLTDAVATIRARRGALELLPGDGKLTPATPAQPSNPKGASRVYHNGAALEKATPLRYGDEVRVSVPDTNTGVPKDFRLRFEDPQDGFTRRY